MTFPDVIRNIRRVETLSPGRKAALFAGLVACYALAQAAVLVPAYTFWLNGSWVRTLLFDLAQAAFVGLPLGAIALGLRQRAPTPFTFLSLNRPIRLGQFGTTFLLTLLAVAIGEIVLRGAEWEEISWRWAAAAASLLPTTVAEAAAEEVIYRGLLLAVLYVALLLLARRLPRHPAGALLLTTLLLAADTWGFAWWHGAQSSVTWTSHVAIGLTACLLLWMTGRLEDAIGYHAANNFCLLLVAGPLILQRGFTGVSQLFQVYDDRERVSQTIGFYLFTSGAILATRYLALLWATRKRRFSPLPCPGLPAGTPPGRPRAGS